MKKRVTKKKLIFRQQFQDYKETGKKMDQTILTQPDMNMSVRELLLNHSRGLPIGATQLKGEYFDTEIPRFDDITDMFEYKKMLAQKHKDLDLTIKSEKKAAAEAAEAAKPKNINIEKGTSEA